MLIRYDFYEIGSSNEEFLEDNTQNRIMYGSVVTELKVKEKIDFECKYFCNHLFFSNEKCLK
jgi:hypothetical protein